MTARPTASRRTGAGGHLIVLRPRCLRTDGKIHRLRVRSERRLARPSPPGWERKATRRGRGMARRRVGAFA